MRSFNVEELRKTAKKYEGRLVHCGGMWSGNFKGTITRAGWSWVEFVISEVETGDLRPGDKVELAYVKGMELEGVPCE